MTSVFSQDTGEILAMHSSFFINSRHLCRLVIFRLFKSSLLSIPHARIVPEISIDQPN